MRRAAAVVATYMIPDDLSSRRLISRDYVMDGDPSAGVLLDTAVANGQLASEYIDTDTHVAKDRTAVHRQARIRVGLCQLWHIRGQKRELSTDCTGQYMYGCM